MRKHRSFYNKQLPEVSLIERIPRLLILGMFFGFLFLILIFRLYRFQIMEGATNQEAFMSSIVKTQKLSGSRGNIYDRNGKLLASNRLSYDVTLEDSKNYKTKKERQRTLNGIAYQLIQMIKDDKKLNVILPIAEKEDGTYEFTADGWKLSRFKADFYGKIEVGELSDKEKAVTADELITELSGKGKFLIDPTYTEEEQKQFGLPESLTPKEVLQIANIRYGISLNSYRKYLPFLVASDVSNETMAAVFENKAALPGADVQESSIRTYAGGESMASILGYTGGISSEELSTLNQQEAIYTNQSVVGKSGIEKSMESLLRGEDGTEQFYTDVVGNKKTEPVIIKAPGTGKDLYLTIDKDLQDAVYKMLEQQIAGILLSNIVDTKRSDMPKAENAAQIRISSDEVYYALLKNHVIDINRLKEESATDLEKSVFGAFSQKKDNVYSRFSAAFDASGTEYDGLSGEMKGYLDYLVSEAKKTKLITGNAGSPDWKNKSFRQYLTDCIAAGLVDLSKIQNNEAYVAIEEEVRLVEEKMLSDLKGSQEFDLKIYEAMIGEGSLKGETIENLLYDQGALPMEDPDRVLLNSGQLSPWAFIQKKIKNLEITPAQLALNPCSGSAVIVDPQDGEVLACVSYPGYDNNRLANQMDAQYYLQLSNDLSLPLFNRATSQLTAPGSTFKPVTVIAGMSEGVINSDTSIVCTGIFDKVQPALRCWKRNGHGIINSPADALKNSCNVYLSEITYRMGTQKDGTYSEADGLQKLQKYANLMDLDKKTGIEIGEAQPHVTDQFSIPSSIGQGTHNYTTTQIARYTTMLANHGKSYDLSLVYKITDSEGTLEKSFTPVLKDTAELPEAIWSEVAKGMNELVSSNASLKDLGVSAAGKTGTAEEAKNKPNHGLFIGYAPLENPKVAIAVRIANGYSSGNVVGVGRGIFDYYFQLKEKEAIITNTASKVSNNLRTD